MIIYLSEAKLQQQCIKYLKSKKIYYINIHGGGWGAKGSPDLITCINGRFTAFELKVGTNDMPPDQKIHRRRIKSNGGLHFCPRSLEEFKSIIENLER